MDRGAAVRSQYEGEQREQVSRLKEEKNRQVRELVADAKQKESQMEQGVGEQIENLKSQIFSIDSQMGQYEAALANPDMPAGEKEKIRAVLDKLRNHKAYLTTQLFKLRSRLDSSKNMLWFHVRTRKEMVEGAIEQQKNLVYRRYAEIFARLASSEAIAKAQQRASQSGVLSHKKREQFGDGGTEQGKMAG